MSFDPIDNGWRKLLKNGGVGYTEPEKVIGSIELNDAQEGTGTYFEGPILVRKFQALKEGETYVVKTDSGTFERVCSTSIKEGRTISFIGNFAMFGGEDNGDSFLVVTTPSLNEPEFIDLIAVDFNFGSHITVSAAETVYTIDPKYLPSGSGGGGLTVVEIGEFDADGKYTLTESEISALEAATAGMMPIIIKFGHDGSRHVAVFQFMSMGDGYMNGFTTIIGGYEYIFLNAMGSWQVMAQGI